MVMGDVPTPLELSMEDLSKLPHERVQLQESRAGKVSYDGVPMQEILKKAGILFGRDMKGKALAGYVLAEARDGYAVVFSLGELDDNFGGEHVFVADKRDGKQLLPEQGPIRLVIPADEAGARSVRMLERLEVVKLRK